MSVWRQTGVKPKELDDLTEFPKKLSYLWKLFTVLSDQRTTDFGNPNPLRISDIMYCASIYGIELEEWEFELIIAFDKLKLNQIYSDMEAKQSKGKSD